MSAGEDCLAEALRDETERRGITQEAAAELIGSTQQTIGKWRQ